MKKMDNKRNENFTCLFTLINLFNQLTCHMIDSLSFLMTLRIYFFIINRNNLSNQNYYKLDTFIRNTAPSNIPISEVLKKAGGLLSVGLNLKA